MTESVALDPEAQHVLRDLNSWWVPPHEVHPTPPRYERRHVANLIGALRQAPGKGQVLRGPRQVGKTTALLQVVRGLLREGVQPREILFVRFDLDILRGPGALVRIFRWFREEIQGTPAGTAPAYLFLDEVHKLAQWDAQVKHVFDTHRPRLVLTGSSSVLVARGQRESLAGRSITTEFPPFLFREVLELTGEGDLSTLPAPVALRDVFADAARWVRAFVANHRQPAQRLLQWRRALDRYYNRGGYPDLHSGAVEDDRWADYLVETVFDRVLGVDIPDLFPVSQPALLRWVYLAAARETGHEISQLRLANQTTGAGFRTNQPTLGKYLHYLVDALLLREFRRYPMARSVSAKVPSKYTLTDLGVRNAIFRGAPSLWESTPEVVGPLVETLVQAVLREGGVQLHFFRDLRKPGNRRSGYDEVDFVAEALDGTVVPVEVKFRKRIERSDLDGMTRFMDRFKPPLGIVVTRDAWSWEPERRLLQVPLLEFLLAF